MPHGVGGRRLVAGATLVGMLGGAVPGQRAGIGVALDLAVVAVPGAALMGLRIPHERRHGAVIRADG
jgi:hypothetical protein